MKIDTKHQLAANDFSEMVGVAFELSQVKHHSLGRFIK